MYNKRIVSRKKFTAKASVFYPVDVIKNQKRSLAIIFKLMHITAMQMIAHYSVNFDVSQIFRTVSFLIVA